MANRRTIIRAGIVVTTLLLLPTCCILGFRDDVGTSATAERSALSGLPAGATNVSWFLPGAFGPNTLYEFSIDEAGFDQWVRNGSSRKLEGPKRGAFSVHRFDQSAGNVEWRELKSTIAYTWSEEDRGENFVYDIDGRRAYYWSHSR